MFEFISELFVAIYDALKIAVIEIVSIISTVTRTIYEGL